MEAEQISLRSRNTLKEEVWLNINRMFTTVRTQQCSVNLAGNAQSTCKREARKKIRKEWTTSRLYVSR